MIGSNAKEAIPLAWVPRGAYIGLPPRDTVVIRLGAGPSRLSLRPSSSPLTAGARQLAGPVGGPGTVAVLLMTLVWSWGCGNSVAAWQAITVAIPRLVWLMACGACGRGRPTPGGRLPRVRLRGALAVFCTPADGWSCRLWVVQVAVVGTVRRPLRLRSGHAWQQCRATMEISSDTAHCSHASPS